MTKFFAGDLVLKEDTVFEESITVDGDIIGENSKQFNLVVKGNIDAMNILCVSRKKKNKNAKTIAYSITLNKFERKRKEVMPEKKAIKKGES
jgi:hypothetical protein